MRLSISLRKIIPLLLLSLVWTQELIAQFTRGVQMNFGKNRVQYNDFLWTFYRFKNFDTYYYLGGQELAVYAGRTADAEIEELEKLFDYRINGRFQLIIYNRLSDLKQTNIGLEGEEQNTNTGGLTRIVGNKILLYFDGDYRHFREQIRAGMTQVMIHQLMYGGNIRDRVQSAVLLNLPDWYLQGLVHYVSQGWSVPQDDRMRDAIQRKRFRNINNLVGSDAAFAGASMWHYIVERYGAGSISNLLYMTRINRNIESGFSYVLGLSLKQLGNEWKSYYLNNAEEDLKDRQKPESEPVVRIKKTGRLVSQVSCSPDGNKLAWVSNDLGKYRIWVYDIAKKKKKKILKGGYKSVKQDVDLSYPALAWHPSGKYLASIRERKGKLWLDYFMTDKRYRKETNKFFYFDKVLDFSYSSSGSEMVLSAIQKGQSDLYTFSPRTKTYTQLTNDRWDDASPRFVLDDRYIVFSSTRTDDSLKPTPLRMPGALTIPKTSDIFLYDHAGKSSKLIPITRTPEINETQPVQIGGAHFAFLSDENGIINRYVSTLDSTIAYIDTVIHYRYLLAQHPQTDYGQGLLEHDINSRDNRYAELVNSDRQYKIRLGKSPEPGDTISGKLRNTVYRSRVKGVGSQSPAPAERKVTTVVIDENQKNTQMRDTVVRSVTDSAGKIDINHYVFQSEFTRKKKTESKPVSPAEPRNVKPSENVEAATQSQAQAQPGGDSSLYQLPKLRNYEIAFSPSYVLTQLDNNLLNETYQAYTGGAVYFTPGLNALFKIGINDLFDDYRFVGGFRLSGNLNSNEYYASFENLRQRLDKQFSFYRQAREQFSTFSYLKIHTHEVKYSVRWPFSDLASLRGMAGYRNDRIVALSTDQFNLALPNQYEHRMTSRLEFVYDNTINTGLNLYNGIRYKLFTELFKDINQQGGWLNVWGADFRHYLKVHRQIIWANRFAASTSTGSEKLIYYLGSTDNSFTPTDNFNTNIQVDPTQRYSFQALATNMRGFIQNIRNGNSFALINSELRIPVFQYLINKPIRSDFVRNFQIIGFGDIGTAWTGPSPYSKTNALFRKEYLGNPISITVIKDIEPIVGGYGFGLRSRVLGYFLRADWAWGVDDGEIQERIFYFSLGLDF